MSKNYDVTIRWHTHDDPTVRETVVKTWASSPKLAHKVGLRGARLDGTLPVGAIIDENAPGQTVEFNIGPPSNTIEPPLPAAQEEERVEELTAKPKRQRKPPREVVLGEFKKVKSDSRMGQLVRALERGQTSIVSLAQWCNASISATSKLLDKLVEEHGISYTIAEGVYLLDGRTADDCIEPGKERAPKTKKAHAAKAKEPKAPRVNKAVDALERARQGYIPVKPVITSETNRHHQKHIDAMAALADEGKWSEVEAYPANGTNTYSRLVRNYKECLLAARCAIAPQRAEE